MMHCKQDAYIETLVQASEGQSNHHIPLHRVHLCPMDNKGHKFKTNFCLSASLQIDRTQRKITAITMHFYNTSSNNHTPNPTREDQDREDQDRVNSTDQSVRKSKKKYNREGIRERSLKFYIK